VDAAQALADLTEISSQIRCAVLFGDDGAVRASTLDDDRARAFAAKARALLGAAAEVRTGGEAPSQLEAATHAGSVFVVRDGDTYIAATTSAEPTVGLVFYDLKTCLRSATADDKPKTKTTRRKKDEGDGA
jgi:predicted regulator of Ras-like GTPase activity (Roadblock/LC7/MglB family)